MKFLQKILILNLISLLMLLEIINQQIFKITNETLVINHYIKSNLELKTLNKSFQFKKSIKDYKKKF